MPGLGGANLGQSGLGILGAARHLPEHGIS